MKNIFACGTVNMTYKQMPKNLSNNKALNRGKYDWAVSSDNIVHPMERLAVCPYSFYHGKLNNLMQS